LNVNFDSRKTNLLLKLFFLLFTSERQFFSCNNGFIVIYQTEKQPRR